jgi:hypothetical protein
LLAKYQRNADPALSCDWILSYDFVLDDDREVR